MRKILLILSTFALLMYPLFLSAQVAMPSSADFDGDGQVRTLSKEWIFGLFGVCKSFWITSGR